MRLISSMRYRDFFQGANRRRFDYPFGQREVAGTDAFPEVKQLPQGLNSFPGRQQFGGGKIPAGHGLHKIHDRQGAGDHREGAHPAGVHKVEPGVAGAVDFYLGLEIVQLRFRAFKFGIRPQIAGVFEAADPAALDMTGGGGIAAVGNDVTGSGELAGIVHRQLGTVDVDGILFAPPSDPFRRFTCPIGENRAEATPLAHLFDDVQRGGRIAPGECNAAGLLLVDDAPVEAFHRKRDGRTDGNRIQTITIAQVDGFHHGFQVIIQAQRPQRIETLVFRLLHFGHSKGPFIVAYPAFAGDRTTGAGMLSGLILQYTFAVEVFVCRHGLVAGKLPILDGSAAGNDILLKPGTGSLAAKLHQGHRFGFFDLPDEVFPQRFDPRLVCRLNLARGL